METPLLGSILYLQYDTRSDHRKRSLRKLRSDDGDSLTSNSNHTTDVKISAIDADDNISNNKKNSQLSGSESIDSDNLQSQMDAQNNWTQIEKQETRRRIQSLPFLSKRLGPTLIVPCGVNDMEKRVLFSYPKFNSLIVFHGPLMHGISSFVHLIIYSFIHSFFFFMHASFIPFSSS